MKYDGKKPIEFTDETTKLEEENLEEVKYKLKTNAPSTDTSVEGKPEDNNLSLDGLEDMEPEDNGEDKPFDDEPFDAGVEADEETDPQKYIQQLSGKLGQTLRQYTDETGQPDFDLEKFAINSVISATHTGEMDPEDQKDIIKKVKNSGEEGGDSGEEIEPNDIESDDLDINDESGEEMEEHHNMSYTDYGKYDRDEYILKGKDIDETDDLPDFTHNPDDFDKNDIKRFYNQTVVRRRDGLIGDVVRFEEGKLMVQIKIGPYTGRIFHAHPSEVDIVDNGSTNELKESIKNGNFVDKIKIIEKLRLMENSEPLIEPKPITKPSIKPSKPMREVDRPFLPKRRDKVKPDPKANGKDIIEDELNNDL